MMIADHAELQQDQNDREQETKAAIEDVLNGEVGEISVAQSGWKFNLT